MYRDLVIVSLHIYSSCAKQNDNIKMRFLLNQFLISKITWRKKPNGTPKGLIHSQWLSCVHAKKCVESSRNLYTGILEENFLNYFMLILQKLHKAKIRDNGDQGLNNEYMELFTKVLNILPKQILCYRYKVLSYYSYLLKFIQNK